MFAGEGKDLTVARTKVMLERKVSVENVVHNCKARNRALVSQLVRMRLLAELVGKMTKKWELIVLVDIMASMMTMWGMRMKKMLAQRLAMRMGPKSCDGTGEWLEFLVIRNAMGMFEPHYRSS